MLQGVSESATGWELVVDGQHLERKWSTNVLLDCWTCESVRQRREHRGPGTGCTGHVGRVWGNPGVNWRCWSLAARPGIGHQVRRVQYLQATHQPLCSRFVTCHIPHQANPSLNPTLIASRAVASPVPTFFFYHHHTIVLLPRRNTAERWLQADAACSHSSCQHPASICISSHPTKSSDMLKPHGNLHTYLKTAQNLDASDKPASDRCLGAVVSTEHCLCPNHRLHCAECLRKLARPSRAPLDALHTCGLRRPRCGRCGALPAWWFSIGQHAPRLFLSWHDSSHGACLPANQFLRSHRRIRP